MSNSDLTKKHVVLVGGLLVDDIAISQEYLRPRSSNPVLWQHNLGGVATNVARVVAQQLNAQLIASTGDDSHGQTLATLIAKEALSASLVIWSSQNSDRYTAVLDSNGELYIGLADARLAEKMTWQDIETRLPEACPDAIVLDANLSATCLTDTLNGLKQHYKPNALIVALAVSPVKSLRLLDSASSIDVLLCNRREAAALSSLNADSDMAAFADALMQKQFKRFVITDGSRPILVQEYESRHVIEVPAIDITKTVNGAGDALAGATIVQLVLGQALAQAVTAAGMSAARSILSGDASPPSV